MIGHQKGRVTKNKIKKTKKKEKPAVFRKALTHLLAHLKSISLAPKAIIPIALLFDPVEFGLV